MSMTFLVRCADGSIVERSEEDLRSDDMVILDGPQSTASMKTAIADLHAQIQAAGGLEAWRGRGETTALAEPPSTNARPRDL